MEHEVYSRLLEESLPARKLSEGKFVIRHDLIEKAVLGNKAFTVEYTPVKADLDHAVVACVIRHASCAVTKFGEFTPGTVNIPGEENFPLIAAASRAFARAAILILNFEEEVFSSKEIRLGGVSAQTPPEPESICPDDADPAFSDAQWPEDTPQASTAQPQKPKEESPKPEEASEALIRDELKNITPDSLILFGPHKGQRIREAEKTSSFQKYINELEAIGASFPQPRLEAQRRYFIRRKGEKG